jgi:hypothetical protein
LRQGLVGDAGGGAGWGDVVDAEDVGSGEDGCGGGCGGGVNPCLRIERWGTWFCDEGIFEEGFAGEAGEDGELEGLELSEVGEEGEVCGADLAEAEAGIDNDLIAGEAGCGGGGDALLESG